MSRKLRNITSAMYVELDGPYGGLLGPEYESWRIAVSNWCGVSYTRELQAIIALPEQEEIWDTEPWFKTKHEFEVHTPPKFGYATLTACGFGAHLNFGWLKINGKRVPAVMEQDASPACFYVARSNLAGLKQLQECVPCDHCERLTDPSQLSPELIENANKVRYCPECYADYRANWEAPVNFDEAETNGSYDTQAAYRKQINNHQWCETCGGPHCACDRRIVCDHCKSAGVLYRNNGLILCSNCDYNEQRRPFIHP